jgi:hypothetical protein
MSMNHIRSRRRLLTPAAALTALALAAPAHAQAPGLAPTSDFFVSSLHKKRSYGKVKELVAGRKRTYQGFLRFSLAAQVPANGHAVLRLYPLANSSTGLIVRRAAGGRWNERSAAFSGAPLMAPGGVTSGPLTKGQWAEIDVTRLVGAGTTASFGLITTSQSPVVVASREAGTLAPQLLVQ